MNGVDITYTTTNHETDIWEKMSLLKNEEQADRMDFHNPEDGPIFKLSETGGATSGPSTNPFVRGVLNMLGRGAVGVQQLSSLLLANEMKSPNSEPWEISSEDAFRILMAVLEHGNPNVRLPNQPSDLPSRELFRQLVLSKNPRIDLRRLSPEASDTLVNELYKRGPKWKECLVDLIYRDRLPNFIPIRWQSTRFHSFIRELANGGPDSMDLLWVLIKKDKVSDLMFEASEGFVNYCFSQGPSGIVLLKVLMVKGMISNLDPSKFSREDAKVFSEKLLKHGQSGKDFLENLIKQGKFPPLASLEDNDSEPWYSACARRMSMVLGKTCRGVWQTTVNVGHTVLEGARGIWQGTVKAARMALARFSSEDSKAFIDRLLGCGEEGTRLLREQLKTGRLPFKPEKMSSKEILDILMMVLARSNPNVESINKPVVEFFELLVAGENPKIDLRRLSPEDSDTLVNELYKRGPKWKECLVDLISGNKLSNFNPGRLSDQDLKIFINGLFDCGPAGMDLMKTLINDDKLPNFTEFDVSGKFEEFVDFCFLQGSAGIDLLEVFLHKDIISNPNPSKFPREKAKAFVNRLLKHGPAGRDLVGNLIEQGKLPHFKSLDEILSEVTLDAAMEALRHSNPDVESLNRAAVERFKQRVLGENPEIDLRRLSPEASHILAGELRKRGPLWKECLIDLVGDNRLTHLKKARNRELSPAQILKGGIGKAFFGETDGIDSWDSIHGRLRNMPLGEARRVWQRIGNEVAETCFDVAGNVDVERVGEWMEFFGNIENFKREPLCFIPLVELMRSQMHDIMQCLFLNRNSARDKLNAAADIAVGRHGQSILAAMSQGRQPPLDSAVAILASLLIPHRQRSFPTCTINSIINAEIRNHPERLIEIYIQMLSRDQFTFPSGYPVQQQPIVNGSITVNLANGDEGRKVVFENIMGGDPAKIDAQIARWREEGVGYKPSTDEAEKYKLEMPAYNMNDVLFAHFFQASNFGNSKIDSNGEFDTVLVYAGHRELGKIRSTPIPVDGSNFLTGMKKLQEHAKAQRALGHSYMRVMTLATKGEIVGGHNHSCHAENIDTAALSALDLNTMEPRKAYVIDDRNWGGGDMSRDIPRLAVRKLDGIPPTYEFGTLQGSTFEKTDMIKFEVYTTDIEERDAAFWDQFRS